MYMRMNIFHDHIDGEIKSPSFFPFVHRINSNGGGSIRL